MAPLNQRRFAEKHLPPSHRKDPYRSQSKLRGRPRCPACSAVSVRGRWTPSRLGRSGETSDGSEQPCPACRQAKDHYAGSVIEIHGHRWKANREEVIETVRNTESI